jgi:hypothetical protein
MLHQKAPHRNWEPDARNQALFKDKVIPEPATLWDDYATRPAALPENQQTVARDLTRRDLKLAARGPQRPALRGSTKPMEAVDGKAHRPRTREVEVPALHAGLPGLRAGRGRRRGPGARLPRPDRPGQKHHRDLLRRQRLVSRRPGAVRQALHVRARPARAAAGPRPGHQGRGLPAQFVANIDLAPTFLDLAGLPIPEFMQGRSLAPLLRGETPPTGAPPSTIATTTTPATTTPPPTSACAPPRTS